jgi:hypothetical protein
VIGYPNVLGLYLPQSVFAPDSATGKINAVIIDPTVTNRLPNGPPSKIVAKHPDRFTLHTIVRLRVYLPNP